MVSSVGVLCGVLCGVVALLILGRVLLGLVQGKGIVRVRLALPGSRALCTCRSRSRRGRAVLSITGGRGTLTGNRALCTCRSRSPAGGRIGPLILPYAAADNHLTVQVLLFVRIAGFDVDLAIFILPDGQIAVCHIIGTRKGRGCNGRNNRHDGCRRQHPQS